MSRRVGRALALVLAGGLALSAGGAALAAPVGALKQFRVPTANSQPRAITTGSDGNVWFTETDLNVNFAKIARITPAGAVTEFDANGAPGCEFGCGISDIAQGPGGILYITNNSRQVMRFNVSTLQFESPVPVPEPGANGSLNDLAVGGGHVWITDFNTDVVWRYNITTGAIDSFPATDPGDIAVDAAGNAWFTQNFLNDDGTSNIGHIDANATPGTPANYTKIPAPAGSITVAPNGNVWFGQAFGQTVGFLDPAAANNQPTVLPVTNTPAGIATAPDGTVWFTQYDPSTNNGNIATITQTGTITEGKTVKGSQPTGITVDANGNPWFTMMAANKIANFQLR